MSARPASTIPTPASGEIARMNTRDIAAEAVGIALRTTPGAGGTAVAVKNAIDGQAIISLIAGVLTVIFLVIQIGYTVRKWPREEGGA